MKKLILPLWWLLQLGTQAKSFRHNPIIGSPVLNRLGLHVARVVLAHCVMHTRMWCLSLGLDAATRRSFFERGYIVVPNILSAEEFTALRAEVASADAEVRECRQGDTLTHRIQLDERTLPALPVCRRVLRNRRLKRLLRFAAGTLTPPICYIQTIKNHYTLGRPDPQKTLHSDTFHPTMKSWLFLDDVDARNGPFTYVPGSNRLTRERLAWEYRQSIAISRHSDHYAANGSLRTDGESCALMKLPPPQVFAVKANTLVIANTHGFHCRGDASEKSMRTELWSISRSNPFLFWFGIDHPWLTALQNRGLDAWRRHLDAEAAQRGDTASWHVISARNTTR